MKHILIVEDDPAISRLIKLNLEMAATDGNRLARVREVIKKYVDYELPEIPANRKRRAFGKCVLSESVGFFEGLKKLSTPIFSNVPKCMEKYGNGYGYIAYRT